MAARRKVAIVTGSRAEYGLLRPVMQAVRTHKKLRLQVIVTGMHLVKRFGYTVTDVQSGGFQIAARVPMQTGRDHKLAQAEALANGVRGIARKLEQLRSDVVVVLGDRIEALAGALAASTTDRLLAHIHGGDVAPGHLDDAFRHAISKLSHVHFAATPDAARRLIKLGEYPEQVHIVGAPGLDDLRSVQTPSEHWLTERFSLSPEHEVALILQHPIGRSARREQQVMNNILGAVAAGGLSGLIVYPNSDPGHSGIIRAISQRCKGGREVRWACARSIARMDFLKCLKAARVLIGNSSAGIIEAHSARTAAVNVGPRQDGRLRSGRSVIDCGESAQAIKAALSKALRLRISASAKSAYRVGRAGPKIAAVLARNALSDNLRPKRIRY